MKDLGAVKRILGMDVHRDIQKGELTLSQCGYLNKVSKFFNMKQAKTVNTPVGAHFRLLSVKDQDEKIEVVYMKNIPYSSAVGSLMYVMVSTRPDLAYGVGLVSRFMNSLG